MPLRYRVAHALLRVSFRLIDPPLTIDGIAMSKLWDIIVALQKGQAALAEQLAAHGDVVGDKASSADLEALAERVTAVEDGPADTATDATATIVTPAASTTGSTADAAVIAADPMDAPADMQHGEVVSG